MGNSDNQTILTVKKRNYSWLRLGLFILLCIIAPFSLFYMHYYKHNIEQQEIRSFRTLNELEGAIDQSIDNLPSIHDKGLFPNISKLAKKITPNFKPLALPVRCK